MTSEAKSARVNEGPEITVKLMGKVAEFAKTGDESDVGRLPGLRMRLSDTESTTPRRILQQLASENPLLSDQILRKDGSPRSSTRILFNGRAPSDLDGTLEIREIEDPLLSVARRVIVIIFDDGTVVIITDVVVIVMVPCDG
jgi:hypothetical protein